MNIGVEINRVRDQIEEIASLLINRRSKCTNSKPRIKVKRQQNSGLTFEFDKDAIELILKMLC